jgi:hypothetical protein
MARLGRGVVSAIVAEYGPHELLRRLSDPFWFQSLGCVMGMDWHSSGITTSVMGALKRGLASVQDELGLYVCGGRGRHSRRTPEELTDLALRTGLDGDGLVRASKLSAKVDNTCLQDGFQLYLHAFVVSASGEWAVVQQGMNQDSRLARRYHWHSAGVKDFVSDPHAAVVGANRGHITNLSDSRADPARTGIVEFTHAHPDAQLRELRSLRMPDRHDVQAIDVDSRRLGAVLATAYEKQLSSFADTLLIPGLGPRTLAALALVSEVIYGAPSRFQDPARFSFAHGGKDGHPFPVLTRTYDESIAVLERGLRRASIEPGEKDNALRQLAAFVQAVESGAVPEADVPAVIEQNRSNARAYGGRTAGDDGPASGEHKDSHETTGRGKRDNPRQLRLF